MNAGVNAAVMQPTRKIEVTDKRKKEDEGSVFCELLELGACMNPFLVAGQQDAADMGGRTGLPAVLTSMDGETFEYSGKKGLLFGEEKNGFPVQSGRKVAERLDFWLNLHRKGKLLLGREGEMVRAREWGKNSVSVPGERME